MFRNFALGLSIAAGLASVNYLCDCAYAARYSVLHVFNGGSDGKFLESGLTEDDAGNLYGTTVQGGGSGCQGFGCGTVFKIAPNGQETVLHAFTGGADGVYPISDLTMDDAGNLYSTTQNGGLSCSTFGDEGCGTVFRIAPDGTKTTLYAFTGDPDGAAPLGRLHRDAAGNLYGTTQMGGGGAGCRDGCGTVFKLAPNGKETILYAFSDYGDGWEPFSLIADEDGDFYGTTGLGGLVSCPHSGGLGCTIFKLAPGGTKSTLYVFSGDEDGAFPKGLIRNKAGDLFGATAQGGTLDCRDGAGCGTVFRLAPDGTKTTLYAFKSGTDGHYPTGRLVQDAAGNLYGVTNAGGKHGPYGSGTIFQIAPDGTETVLKNFIPRLGVRPYGRLKFDHNGNLVGTTYRQGRGACEPNKQGRLVGCGVVFRFRP